MPHLTPIILTSDGLRIPLLFEHANVLAVDKPEGLAAIPEGAGESHSLRSQLEEARGEKLFVVHRLDKDVSGVILFARNAETHRFLNDQFTARRVHKIYAALAHGVITRIRGEINRPLREFGSGRMAVDPEHGKPSLTRFRVVERFAHATLVQVEPTTGRRHQIRAHFYSIGHPLVGDRRYGDRAQQATFPRLMLHAHMIEFALPDRPQVRVESPIPPAFEAILTHARSGTGNWAPSAA